MKTIIFLDIDGVVNHHPAACQFHLDKTFGNPLSKDRLNIDEQCLDRVMTLQKEFNADIVISSMWRFGAKIEWFQELFNLYGHELPLEKIDMIDCTDYEDADGYRGTLIERYLKESRRSKYVAIDDTLEHYHNDFKYVVFTQMKTGFTQENLEEARQMLHRQAILR